MDLVSIFRKDMMKKAPLSKMVTPYKSRLAWIIMLWSRPIFLAVTNLSKVGVTVAQEKQLMLGSQ